MFEICGRFAFFCEGAKDTAPLSCGIGNGRPRKKGPDRAEERRADWKEEEGGERGREGGPWHAISV